MTITELIEGLHRMAELFGAESEAFLIPPALEMNVLGFDEAMGYAQRLREPSRIEYGRFPLQWPVTDESFAADVKAFCAAGAMPMPSSINGSLRLGDLGAGDKHFWFVIEQITWPSTACS